MGWISVGLLIVSGSCILYRHPPTSFVQLLFKYHILRSRRTVQQSQAAEETSPDDDVKQGQSRCAISLSINIGQPKENYSPEGDSGPVSRRSSPASSPADLSTKLMPPSSTESSARSPPSLKRPTVSSMPPPPRPPTRSPLQPPPSAAASLRVRPTKTLSTAAFAPSRPKSTPAKGSRQVMLTPGHSPLDWAALTSDPNNQLRGKDAAPDKLLRVPPSQLKHQNGRKGRDAWTAYHGRVYNITPYLLFHPGGEGELMRGAGRDAAKLFMEVHPWVNWEAMLGECLVGILVAEGEEQHGQDEGAGELDEMD